MRQIQPHLLWLGHADDGRDYQCVLDSGIGAIVQIALEEPALQPPREILYFRIPLVDGPGNDLKHLYLAVTSVANLLEKRVPTLVCCSGGLSRSPAIAAAALSMVYQENLDDCLKQVAEHHPADVTPGFWNDVKGLLESDRF
jgi:hypothetical protein